MSSPIIIITQPPPPTKPQMVADAETVTVESAIPTARIREILQAAIDSLDRPGR